MANLKDKKVDPRYASFLFVGAPGSGKTHFLKDVPGVYIYDFDNGLLGLRGHDIEYDTFKDAPEGAKPIPEEGIYEWGKGWTAFYNKVLEHHALIQQGKMPFKAVALDSLTMLQTLAMNNILKNDKKKEDDQPQIQHWGALNRAVSKVLNAITSWPMQKFLMCHVERGENPLTNTVEFQPLLSGKMQGLVPAYCDEIYFFDLIPKGLKENATVERRLVTLTSGLHKSARSRLGVPNYTEASYPALLKALGLAPEALPEKK